MAKEGKSKAPRRSGTSKVREKLEQKLKDTRRSAKAREQKGRTRGRIAAIGGAGVVGLGRRAVAHMKEKGAKGDLETAAGRMTVASARDDAHLPHIKALGEAGTYGLGMGIAGFLVGSADLVDAGTGALAAQAFLSGAGYETRDARAAELRGQSVGALDDGDYDDDDDAAVSGYAPIGGDDATHPALEGMNDDELAMVAGVPAGMPIVAGVDEEELELVE